MTFKKSFLNILKKRLTWINCRKVGNLNLKEKLSGKDKPQLKLKAKLTHGIVISFPSWHVPHAISLSWGLNSRTS